MFHGPRLVDINRRSTNTKIGPNVGLILVHRVRCRTSIKRTLSQRLVFAGWPLIHHSCPNIRPASGQSLMFNEGI